MKSIYWAWALKNIVVIACWTALAIFFGKWWIALFAGLFTSKLERSTSNDKEMEEN